MAETRCSACGASISFDPETLRYQPRLFGSGGRLYCEACRASAPETATELDGQTDLGINLGAFCFTPLWLLFHGRVVTGLALFGLGLAGGILIRLPSGFQLGFLLQVVGWFLVVCLLGASLRFGGTGNSLLWASGRFGTVSELRDSQKHWQLAGKIWFSLSLLAALFVILVGVTSYALIDLQAP